MKKCSRKKFKDDGAVELRHPDKVEINENVWRIKRKASRRSCVLISEIIKRTLTVTNI